MSLRLGCGVAKTRDRSGVVSQFRYRIADQQARQQDRTVEVFEDGPPATRRVRCRPRFSVPSIMEQDYGKRPSVVPVSQAIWYLCQQYLAVSARYRAWPGTTMPCRRPARV